jgi:hypothetical protein
MATTAVYLLPYQVLGDAPDGPNLGQNLAERVEAVLQSNLTLGGNLVVPGSATANTMVATTSLTVAGVNIGSAVSTLLAPGWVDYSASLAWTSSGTPPAFGNATKLAEYRRSPGGDMVEVRIKIVFGSTTTFGTGVWFFSLPVNAHANEIGMPCGGGWGLDTAIKESGGVAKIESATTFRLSAAPVASSTNDNWSAAVPFTWGNTDTLWGRVRYQAA